jgi:hypothetical protein
MNTVPNVLDVACGTGRCEAFGRPRRVYVRLATVGVVEMPRWVCQRCGAEMSRLPPEGYDMAKITAHGGPSNAVVNPPTPEHPSTRVDPADGTRPLPALAAPPPAVPLPAIVDGAGEVYAHPGTGVNVAVFEGLADVDPAARPDPPAPSADLDAAVSDQPDNTPDNSPVKPVVKRARRATRKAAPAGG